MVGPIEKINDYVCYGCSGKVGPTCLNDTPGFDDACPDDPENGYYYCKNNGTQPRGSWLANTISSCDCTGTGYYGWHCEYDNKELCSDVDHGR